MTVPCIVVVGVSGVGKTTACTKFTNREPKFIYIRASMLLGGRQGRDLQSVLSNQDFLGREIAGLRDANPGRPVLIDGHTVIAGSEVMIPVPPETLTRAGATGLVLLEAPVEEVQARRHLAGRQLKSDRLILAELVAERSHAQSLSQQLKIPLVVREVGANFELDEAIFELTE